MNFILNARTAVFTTAICTTLFSGCASIVNGTNQIVSVETRLGGQLITGVTCKLENSKGVFYVTTPGTVTLLRSYADLAVKCEKENIVPGLATVKSSTKAMAFGNILFGGVVGVAIDAGTGAAYDYPNQLTVMMGEVTQLPSKSVPMQEKTDTITADASTNITTP